MSIQRNVQRQNADTKAEIRRVADMFRCKPLSFTWLTSLLQKEGVNNKSGILVDLSETPEQEGILMSGLWLCGTGEFWEFAVMLSLSTRELIDVEEFRNVTASVLIEPSIPGTGNSFGFLAHQVQDEVCNNQTTGKVERG